MKLLLQLLALSFVAASLVILISLSIRTEKRFFKQRKEYIANQIRPMKDSQIVRVHKGGMAGIGNTAVGFSTIKVPDERYKYDSVKLRWIEIEPKDLIRLKEGQQFFSTPKLWADSKYLWIGNVADGYFVDTIKNRILDHKGKILADWK